MRPRSYQVPNGPELTYRVIDDAGARRTLVMAGGLGGTHLVWGGLTRRLRKRFKIVIWDYPGLTAGGNLAPEIAVDVPALASYQEAVFDAARIESACLVGWSLGTQVAIEFTREHAARCEALIAVCGTAAPPFFDDREQEPLAAVVGLRSSVPGAVSWMSERLDSIDTLRSMLRRIERPTRWAKRLGLVDPVADELVFDAVIRDFIELNTEVYHRYAMAAADHDGSDVLAGLETPLLALAGQRDRLLPARRVKEMVAGVPGAEYLEVRGATHFLPLEYAELLALRIEDFLERRAPR